MEKGEDRETQIIMKETGIMLHRTYNQNGKQEFDSLRKIYNMEGKFTRREHNLESCWVAKPTGIRVLCLPPLNQ